MSCRGRGPKAPKVGVNNKPEGFTPVRCGIHLTLMVLHLTHKESHLTPMGYHLTPNDLHPPSKESINRNIVKYQFFDLESCFS
jgi:hypothetical protein